MITSIIFIILLGCFTLYNTSKKAVLTANTIFEQWVQSTSKISKIIGYGLLVAALFVCTYHFGNTSGFLFWLITVMTLLCLVIIIAPLKLVRYTYLLTVYIISLITELIINYAS